MSSSIQKNLLYFAVDILSGFKINFTVKKFKDGLIPASE
jgi:hypothetical protein